MSLDVLKQQQDPSRDRFSSSFGKPEMVRPPVNETGGREGGEEAIKAIALGKNKEFRISANDEADFMFWVGVFSELSSEADYTRDTKKKLAIETAAKAALDVREKLKAGTSEKVDVQTAKSLIEKAFATVQ